MTNSHDTTLTNDIAADYSITPSQLAYVIKDMIEIRQPAMVWGPPGIGKSQIAQQVASGLGHDYIDVRALLLDPVDLRGIPWRDDRNRTRWAAPDFLPESDSANRHLINFDELPAAPPSTQNALLQLILDRAIGEYVLPDGTAMIACGNRESDRVHSHRMSTALASRFVHYDLRVDVDDWSAWAAQKGIAPEVLFFISMRPEILHNFDPQRRELAFPCPRTWEFVSNLVNQNRQRSSNVELANYRGAVGEGAATEFYAFLQIWREIPHPRTILADPHNAEIPGDSSALIALCGGLYRLADDTNLDSIVAYAQRLRPEIGEFLVSSCIRRDSNLQYTRAFIRWTTLAAA